MERNGNENCITENIQLREMKKDKWCETYSLPSYNKSLSVMEKTQKKK